MSGNQDMNLGAVGCHQGMMQCLRKKARVGQMKMCSYIDNDPLNDSGQKDVRYGMSGNSICPWTIVLLES